jgi:alpha-1,2-mannosyltransferase
VSGAEKWLPRAAPAVMILCAGWYVYHSVIQQAPTASLSDFRWYYLAARHITHGESPYLAEGYLYSPLLACLITPLAFLEYVPARWIWFLISHACLLSAAWLIWRHLGGGRLAGCIVAIVWAFGGAAAESLSLGQIGPELTLLLAAAYTLTPRLQGASAGTGFALKLIPGVICLIFVLRRDIRAVLTAVTVAVVLTSISWGIVACCSSGPRAPARLDYLSGTPSVLSWSLPSVALRVYKPFRSGKPMPHDWITGNTLQELSLSPEEGRLSLVVALITLAVGCVILAMRVGGRLEYGQTALASAAMIALALAASPISWTHYQVMQYPGVALFLGYAARRRLWRLFGAVTACAAFLYPIPVAVLKAYYDVGNSWPNSPLVMYFWTSVSAVASVALFGLMACELPHLNELRREPKDLNFRAASNGTLGLLQNLP